MKPQTFSQDGVRYEDRFLLADLRFEEITYAPGFRNHSHVHEQEAFFDLGLSGNIREFWENRSFDRGPSNLIFLPARTPHGNHYQEGGRALQIGLKGRWLDRIRQLPKLAETPGVFEDGPPAWIAARLYREFQQRDAVSSLVLEGILLELLGEIARDGTRGEEDTCPKWLRQAKDFLHAHFTENITADSVATAVGVNPSHLMRCFRRQHRCTVGEYVRKLRVEYACHLLTTSDANPSQIAHSLGFADQSHFNRTFKNLTKSTPTEFSKAAKRASVRQEKSVSSNR